MKKLRVQESTIKGRKSGGEVPQIFAKSPV